MSALSRPATILLIRHGRVDFASDARLRAGDLGAHLRRFERAGIRSDSRPPRALCERVRRTAVVVCSDLERAVQSAAILAPDTRCMRDALFREAELPARPPLPGVHRFRAWIVLARILWRLGWAAGAESFRRARERAGRAASRLAELAQTHGSVVLVGHGYFNRLVAAALRRVGWAGPLRPSVRNWGRAVYRG